MKHRRSVLAAVSTAALVTGLAAGSASAASAASAAGSANPVTATAGKKAVNVCGIARPGEASCFAKVIVDPATNRPMTAATPQGYGPSDLRNAYKLPTTGGTGQTIAIVDAYDDPMAESDLAKYRSTYGLPACTTANGCFKKVNQNGVQGSYPLPDSGWALEISLDLDMVSATCANCHILLVEANSSSFADLGASVNTAARLGANAISNSYGSNYSSPTNGDARDSTYAKYYNHPHIAVTASSGDSGYGDSYPATSRYVVAVGGTSLHHAGNARGWTEHAWSGAGSGCSIYNAKPAWQADTGCHKRMEADVSAVADPYTGVAVYDTFAQTGWLVVGGTSASSPIIAGVYALAGNAASVSYPAQLPYQRHHLYDVVSGSNGSCSPAYFCHAVSGYDGPTGLGTPNGTAGF